MYYWFVAILLKRQLRQSWLAMPSLLTSKVRMSSSRYTGPHNATLFSFTDSLIDSFGKDLFSLV